LNELKHLPIPLLQWYQENARVLPWRSDPTPYKVLVSEIMLQQTRVAAVKDYFQRFIKVLPTVADLATVEEDRLLKLWQGLGYYNRARNLQKAARQVIEQFGGKFPASYDALRTLAGVGDYTAGAIASIAFGIPVPAVDGNVLRVVSRITGNGDDITKLSTKKRMSQAVGAVIPVRAPGDFNQALMELGATVCLPNGAPLCHRCPAGEFCRARQENRTDALPVRPPKKMRKMEKRTVFLLFYKGRVALRRRPERGLLAGLWEYPNELFPVEKIPEEWGLAATGVSFAAVGRHIFTHVEWRMTALVADLENDCLPKGWVWAGRMELDRDYAVPSAFGLFRSFVEDRLRAGERSERP
jgi:A/G-specific adenine glycosylase